MRTKEADAERQRQRRAADREAYNRYMLERYYANREERLQRDKEWRARNRASYSETRRRWREANKSAVSLCKRKWYTANRTKCRARGAQHRAALLSQCPPWVDRSALAAIYAGRPVGFTVDHIVPLRGVTPDGWPICGLHVPCNLQYLTKPANSAKGSRMSRADWLLCIAAMPLTAQEITVA